MLDSVVRPSPSSHPSQLTFSAPVSAAVSQDKAEADSGTEVTDEEPELRMFESPALAEVV